LARESGLSIGTVHRLEAGAGCHLSTLQSVLSTFANHGVSFESSGIRIAQETQHEEPPRPAA
jgi:hypothetical protein